MEKRFDVIVVEAVSGGRSHGVSPAESGAKVLVLERDDAGPKPIPRKAGTLAVRPAPARPEKWLA